MIPGGEQALPDDLMASSDGEQRSDSGVSTMDSSTCRCSFSGLLEANNNLLSADPIDVVSLLRLRSAEDEAAQVSNSSSLESLTSLDNNQGSGGEDDAESGSTSCSEDSFEMSSTCGMETSPDGSPLRTTAKEEAETASSSYMFRPPPSSISMDSFMTTNKLNEAIRRNIDYELSTLDTGLPQLDFDKLERQLVTAAKEREEQERRLLGEEVRRRLALQVDSNSGPMPPVNTRPHRSNLAVRLQTAMNLQVCYMNELAESGAESDEDDSSDDDDGFQLSKSKSAPNLEKHCQPGPSRSEEVVRLRRKAKNKQMLDPYERHRLLSEETKTMLAKAKIEGQKKVDEFRRNKSRASVVPRQSRQALSKLSLDEVRRIWDTMEEAINRKNKELVQLLMDRDTLHMEHDSLLVDIEDFTEHETQATALDFPQLLAMQDGDIAPAKPQPPLLGATALPGSKVIAPTPTTTPTSPSRSFVIPHLPTFSQLPQLPNSLSSFFRR